LAAADADEWPSQDRVKVANNGNQHRE